ncbi:MAG TPA: ABC-2 transporter permease [Clostridiaceae bacterium]|jgi:ABC-2 type transport system permease protein|nr:ABC-2 transporter permease [Clostridiaceae bacterium]
MIALMYKDLVALKKALFLLVIILFLVGFYTMQQGKVMALPLMFMLVPLILIGMLWGSDTKSNVDQYIIPGPIKRRTIVLSRYAFVWIVAVIGAVFAVLLKLFAKDSVLSEIPWYLIAVALLFLTTVVSVIQLPLMYKFGAEKARLIFVALYFIVFAFFSYVGGNKDLIIKLFDRLILFDLRIIGLAILGVTFLLNAVSFTLSAAIYAKKEF